ncbi:MAG: ATP-binding cassette domain-containing protein, partial [Silvanigrellaceae bacterium]|nr:ATP-binding cassette domain-containing protein [Silvanigrellaceae bacterium]
GERIALVGPNGAGKTSLLNIICNLEDADSGQVVKPQHVKIGYLPQEPNAYPKQTILEECLMGAQKIVEIQDQLNDILIKMELDYSAQIHKRYEDLENQFRNLDGYELEARAKTILLGLGFKQEQLNTSPLALSGGWRMRLELAKIFLNSPDFLILDEPTNHLDLPSLVWVENYLQSFPGTLLYVSHDRNLLNRLSTVTLHLYKGKLQAYKGNFDSFLEQREKRLELEAQAAQRLKKRMEDIQRFVDRFKAKASKARQAQSKAKMLSRLKDLESDFDLDDGGDEIFFTIPKPAASGKEVLTIEKGATGYSTKLSSGVHLKVLRGQKIAVIGSNGIGKSTFLKTVAGYLAPLEGTFELGYNAILGYFAQNQMDMFDESQNVLQTVLRSSPRVTERQARSLLGNFLFRGDDAFKPIKVLSGGEKNRVGLACLLLQEANFLLLDEPTNHLDMSSSEVLANALAEYEGTLLFVSHNRSFINEVCSHVFVLLADGRSALFEGNLEDYARLAKVANFPNILEGQSEQEKVQKTYGKEEKVSQKKRGSSPEEKSFDKTQREAWHTGDSHQKQHLP